MNAPNAAGLAQLRAAAVMPGDAALARVLSLPRKSAAPPALVSLLSRHLCTNPTQQLRQAQAEALCELWEYRGLFGALGVGAGKTLLTLLAATLLGSKRPVLLIPSTLEEKTRREFVEYMRLGWKVRLPELVSYELLRHPKRDGLLFKLAPDLLMADECTDLFNWDCRTVRQWWRYVQAAGDHCTVAVMSGTLLGANLMKYHHLAIGSLGQRAPLPTMRADAERWAQALDRDLGIMHRLAPGELDKIPGGFHEWFRGSRGVVAMQASECDASIRITPWVPKLPPLLRTVIDGVVASGMRPDDELLDELEVPECLSQLALGFYLHWDPAPPDWWLQPRRRWFRYVRDVLDAHLEGFDSTAPIVYALDYDQAPPDIAPPDAAYGRQCLAEWRAVRDAFVPNSVPVFLTDAVLEQAAAHAKANPGTLVWVAYKAAGHKLHELGIPYYGGHTNPDLHKPVGQSIAVSLKAHHKGKNLQTHHRALVLNLPANSAMWEQTIAREHRANQKADTVVVEPICVIDHHGKTLTKVLAEARADEKASGFTPKILLGDWTT